MPYRRKKDIAKTLRVKPFFDVIRASKKSKSVVLHHHFFSNWSQVLVIPSGNEATHCSLFPVAYPLAYKPLNLVGSCDPLNIYTYVLRCRYVAP